MNPNSPDKPTRRDGECSCDFYPSCSCGDRDDEYPLDDDSGEDTNVEDSYGR